MEQFPSYCCSTKSTLPRRLVHLPTKMIASDLRQSIGFASHTPLFFIRTARSSRTTHPSMCVQPRGKRPVLVIGAGIIGLTAAIRLHESNYDVSILTQETPSTIFSPENTKKTTYSSSGSGGLWMPVLLNDPRIPAFASDTYHTLISHIPLNVGVKNLEGFLLSKSEHTLPWYAEMTNMERVSPRIDKRVPTRYQNALRFWSPVMEMDKYLLYLESVLQKYGIPVVLTGSRTEAGENARWGMKRIFEYSRDIHPNTIIINCAGMGAGKLSDDVITPGRGVILQVKRPKELDYHISENYEDGFYGNGLMAYAIPRGDDMTLGGTVFKDDWNEDATEEEIAGVRERAEGLLGVSGLTEIGRWTGLRPITEGGVRIGLFNGVVCNYGHGGSGVTLCWGCADEVVRIVDGMA